MNHTLLPISFFGCESEGLPVIRLWLLMMSSPNACNYRERKPCFTWTSIQVLASYDQCRHQATVSWRKVSTAIWYTPSVHHYIRHMALSYNENADFVHITKKTYMLRSLYSRYRGRQPIDVFAVNGSSSQGNNAPCMAYWLVTQI